MAVYQLKSRIPQIMAALDPKVQGAIKQWGEEIVTGAKERVPVASGDLRDAIHLEDVEGGVSVVAGDENVFYGHIVENGGAFHAPRPFLIPAFEASRDEGLKGIEDALEDL